jgi:hypothetical protein
MDFVHRDFGGAVRNPQGPTSLQLAASSAKEESGKKSEAASRPNPSPSITYGRTRRSYPMPYDYRRIHPGRQFHR